MPETKPTKAGSLIGWYAEKAEKKEPGAAAVATAIHFLALVIRDMR